MPKQILITGVGGNVGQYLAQALYMNGYSVIGIYRNNRPKELSYELMQADLSEIELNYEGVDTVIHVAAGLYGSTEKLIRDNINTTINLVKFAERKKIRKFIYMSTVSVYGKVDGILNVDSDIVNPSVYGATKYIAENIVKESNIPFKIVIGLPRMLGPFVDLNNIKNSGFLTMAKKILLNEDVTCFIPDVLYNNYMHVFDLMNFIQTLIENELDEKYVKVLLGAKDSLSMLEILNIMKDAIHSKSNIYSENIGNIPECALVNIDSSVKIGYVPSDSIEMLSRFMVEVSCKSFFEKV